MQRCSIRRAAVAPGPVPSRHGPGRLCRQGGGRPNQGAHRRRPGHPGREVAHTGKDGAFRIEGTGDNLKLRALGYARREIATAELSGPNSEITLTPFKVKALYLTVYGAASRKIRSAALETIEKNGMNALVIDVKGDRGFIPFKVDMPLADEIGAQKTILFKDIQAFIDVLKEKDLYLIARIVVFKDDPLAAANPQLAVKTRGGGVFRDREKLRWVDPFSQEVWDYNIAIAKIAAAVGFDEIQFDYVRCPDNRGVVFNQPKTISPTAPRSSPAF